VNLPMSKTDRTCPNCGQAKLLAQDSPEYVQQSTRRYDDGDKLWWCSDPDCFSTYGSWIDGE
jgi:hypothetical protein